MRKATAIIQARMGASRLPGKVLFKLEGKTVLEHVVERVRKSRMIRQAVVATSVNNRDLKIVSLCRKKKIPVFCGSEEDCLERFYRAAKCFQAEHIVRITSDCPLLDYKIINKVINLYFSKKADYATNTMRETFPDGEDVEVFSLEALELSWQKARLASEREHVTPFMRNHPGIFKLANLEALRDYNAKRWTLDEERDFKFIKLIYRRLYRDNHYFGMSEVLRLLKEHPEYEELNRGIQRNNGYLKSLKKDRIFNE